jgi:hypothetical protein
MKIYTIVSLWVLVLVGATACASGGRLPSDTVAVVTPLALGPPPIYALVGYREELKLTSEQITALDAIAQEVEEQNLPLIEELRTKSSERSRSAGQLVVGPDGAELLNQIKANQQEAAEAVEAVLVEEQRTEVCKLYERPGDERPASRQAPPRASRDSTSANLVMRPITWPWCSSGERQGQVS